MLGWVAEGSLNFDGIDGDHTGFVRELAVTLSDATGFDIEVRQLADRDAGAVALGTGEIDLLLRKTAFPIDTATFWSSVPVARSVIRAYVESPAAPGVDLASVTSGRVGVIAITDASLLADLRRRAEVVTFRTGAGLLYALLSGEVDAAVAPFAVIGNIAFHERVENRISAVGDPLWQSDLVLSAQASRGDMIGRIEAALQALEADGHLTDIRVRRFMVEPDPVPDVLTVGMTHYPPYQVIAEDGTYTGYAVEFLRTIAAQTGTPLRFVPISTEEFGRGPGSGRYDIFPSSSVTDERRQLMDFSLPIDRRPVSIFVGRDETREIRSLADLRGLKVGVQVVNVAQPIVEQFGGLDIVYFDTAAETIFAIGEGKVDAIVYPRQAALGLAEELGVEDTLRAIDPPVTVFDIAVVLRFGLGDVRERFDAVIPGYLASDAYEELRAEWIEPAVFWTPDRIQTLVWAFITLILAGLTMGVISLRSANKREERNARLLAELVTDLERSNRDLDDFAQVASHDLREPLRGIAINASFLGQEELSDAAKARLQRMIELCAKSETIVTELQQYARMRKGDTDPVFVQPADVIEEVLEELKEYVAERNGRVLIETRLPPVLIERPRLKTLFRNLIVNGLKYNDSETPTVWIGYDDLVTVNGVEWKGAFHVRDNGVGIPLQHHDRAFRIFSRLHSRKRYGEGTGSGLSFVKKIVETSGGKIEIVSEPGSGTTFYLTVRKDRNPPVAVSRMKERIGQS